MAKKLIDRKTFCILSPAYYAKVFEVASLWVKIPYSTNLKQMAWMGKNKGFLLTGFKLDWPPPEYPFPNWVITKDKIATLVESPLGNIFIAEEIYNQIKLVKGIGCSIETTAYKKVKTKFNDQTTRSVDCFIAEKFIKELSEKEIRNLASLNNVIAGVSTINSAISIILEGKKN